MTTTRFACVIADILYILFSLKFSMFLDGIRPPRIGPAAKGALPLGREPALPANVIYTHYSMSGAQNKAGFRHGMHSRWIPLEGQPALMAIPPTGADFYKTGRLLLSQPAVSHAVSSFARVRAKRRFPVLLRPAKRLTAFPHPATATCNAGSESRRLQFPSCNTGTSSSLPRRAPPLFYGPRRPTCSFP